MLVAFSDLDRFVPSVEALVHHHCLFNFVVLNKDVLGQSEVLVQDSQFSFNLETVGTFNSNHFVELAKVLSTSHVSKSCVTSLGNI